MTSPPVLSFEDLSGRAHLAVILKRAYSLEVGQALRLLDDVVDVRAEAEMVGPGDAPELIGDADVLALRRTGVDVLLRGHVYAPRGESDSVDAALTIGEVRKVVRAVGARRVTAMGATLSITKPRPFARVPLSYRRAFGGIARGVGAYPRNAIGVGFGYGAAAALDAAPLPQLEDPADPLTMQRILTHDPERWFEAPVPAGFGPISMWTFPRLAATWPVCLPCRPEDVYEVARGPLTPADVQRPPETLGVVLPFAYTTASAGLGGLHLGPSTPLVLEHLHPDAPRVETRLPAPQIAVELVPPGCPSVRAEVALRAVEIEPDQRRLVLTYVASTPVSFQFPEAVLADVRVQCHWR